MMSSEMGVRRYLLTGGSGFLGKAIRERLLHEGHHVTTVGKSAGSDVVCDLRYEVPLLAESVDIVVHNAGKAHVVPKTHAERQDFYDVNVQGTEHLLEGLLQAPALPLAIIYISSVAVYGLTAGENIREDYPAGAADPYGQSKVRAEELLARWSAQHGVSLTILRLPLLAGKEPPGNLGSMIRGIRKGYYRSIGGGSARKSMVMAEDVAAIISTAADHAGIYHLTDGHHPSFKELEEMIVRQLQVDTPSSLGLRTARLLGTIGDIAEKLIPGKFPVTSMTIEKITSSLTFDDTKARNELGWKPRRVLDAFKIS